MTLFHSNTWARLALATLLCSIASAQAPTPSVVTVAGPIYDLTGHLFKGSISLTLQAINSNGVPVRSQPIKLCTPGLNLPNCFANSLVNGQFTSPLVINGSATPAATVYTVVYSPAGGSSFTEFWSVPGPWIANHAYLLGQGILDSNGNIQVVTTAGTSGSTAPTWNVTTGNTTADLSPLVWTNKGAPTPALVATGANTVNPDLRGPAGTAGRAGDTGATGAASTVPGPPGVGYVANVAGTCSGSLCYQIVLQTTHLQGSTPVKVQCYQFSVGTTPNPAVDCPSALYPGAPGDLIFSYTSGEVQSFQIASPGQGPPGSGGGGGGSMVYPAAGVPSSSGTAWNTSYGFVTSVGSPGLDTNIASEKAIRTALTAAVASITASSLGLATVATSGSYTDLSSKPTLGTAAAHAATDFQAVITGAPGSWPFTFAPSAHAASHQNGGSDEVATATPGANAIPKAGGGGTLANGWIGILNQNTTGTAASLVGPEITTPSAPVSDILYFSSINHIPQFTKATSSAVDGTMLIPKASRTANQFLGNIGAAGDQQTYAIAPGDVPNIAESQVTSLVSDLAAKAPLANPAFTGTATAVNLTVSGTCTGCGSGGGGATKISGSATFAYGAPICDGCCLQAGTTVTVTGAIAGDPVTIGASPTLADGINVVGKTTASDTVTVEVCNWTGLTTVTPASTTYLATIVH